LTNLRGPISPSTCRGFI